jgi:hypothetical protein
MNRLPEFGNLLYKALMNTEFQHHNDGHEVPLDKPSLYGDPKFVVGRPGGLPRMKRPTTNYVARSAPARLLLAPKQD